MSKKKKNKNTWFVLLGILFFLWVGKTFIQQRIELRELEKVKIEKEKEKKRIAKEIKTIEKEIENKDSLEFIEKVAREDYKMVKPREIIYIDKNREKKQGSKD